MDAADALRMAAPQLGATLFVPHDAAPGELVIEFQWLGRSSAWVTNGLTHFVAVPMRLPFGLTYGASELENSDQTLWIGDLPVNPMYGMPFPIDELRSGPVRDWLAGLDLSSGDTLDVHAEGVAFTTSAADADADRLRVLRFLDSLSAMESTAIDEPGKSWAPMPEVDSRLRSSIAKFRDFIRSDDAVRDSLVASASEQQLRAIVDEVRPLLGDIDAALDQFASLQGRTDAATQEVESDLHSLAQLAVEAEQALDSGR